MEKRVPENGFIVVEFGDLEIGADCIQTWLGCMFELYSNLG